MPGDLQYDAGPQRRDGSRLLPRWLSSNQHGQYLRGWSKSGIGAGAVISPLSNITMSERTHRGVVMEPQGGFARLIFKLRQEGPAWILRRLQSELTLPTTKPGKILHATLRRTIAAGSAPVRS